MRLCPVLVHRARRGRHRGRSGDRAGASNRPGNSSSAARRSPRDCAGVVVTRAPGTSLGQVGQPCRQRLALDQRLGDHPRRAVPPRRRRGPPAARAPPCARGVVVDQHLQQPGPTDARPQPLVQVLGTRPPGPAPTNPGGCAARPVTTAPQPRARPTRPARTRSARSALRPRRGLHRLTDAAVLVRAQHRPVAVREPRRRPGAGRPPDRRLRPDPLSRSRRTPAHRARRTLRRVRSGVGAVVSCMSCGPPGTELVVGRSVRPLRWRRLPRHRAVRRARPARLAVKGSPPGRRDSDRAATLDGETGRAQLGPTGPYRPATGGTTRLFLARLALKANRRPDHTRGRAHRPPPAPAWPGCCWFSAGVAA